MSDIKIFKFGDAGAQELKGSSVAIERSLQRLIEKNLQVLLGVRFLATEYSLARRYSGRIDTLGIDLCGCPVIIEYKKQLSESIINQAVAYLKWLKENPSEFELLVQKVLGRQVAETIDLKTPRVLCIAADFGKYDIPLVEHFNGNIELIRYRKFGEDLLMLETVCSSGVPREFLPSQGHEQPEDQSGPASEDLTKGGITESKAADRGFVLTQFWVELFQKAAPRISLHQKIRPRPEYSMHASSCVSCIWYTYVIRDELPYVQLYINRNGDMAGNKAWFDEIQQHKNEIETAYGQPLIWDRMDGFKSCRVLVQASDKTLGDKEHWPLMQDEMISAMIRFKQAMDPVIQPLAEPKRRPEPAV